MAEITVSTVHKSKGREWDSIKCAEDFFAPRPDEFGMLSPPAAPECMVGYVAVTRARYVLDRAGLAFIDDFVDGIVEHDEQDEYDDDLDDAEDFVDEGES
jgi:superfamily I DNA/RNA helicase